MIRCMLVVSIGGNVIVSMIGGEMMGVPAMDTHLFVLMLVVRNMGMQRAHRPQQ